MNGTYDEVGLYNQDKVNGFTEDLFSKLFSKLQLRPNLKILDHMCGNGNLIQRAYSLFPDSISTCEIYCMDISKKQLEIGRKMMDGNIPDLYFWHGDVRNLPFKSDFFDRAIRKSGSHEIPKKDQCCVFDEVYRTLKPEGFFVELGIAMEHEDERDEFLATARVKDSLAGLTSLVENRYFLTAKELFGYMDKAGFSNIDSNHDFNYNISVKVVIDEYLKGDPDKAGEYTRFLRERCPVLWSRGILVEEDGEMYLRAPGKILLARK